MVQPGFVIWSRQLNLRFSTGWVAAGYRQRGVPSHQYGSIRRVSICAHMRSQLILRYRHVKLNKKYPAVICFSFVPNQVCCFSSFPPARCGSLDFDKGATPPPRPPPPLLLLLLRVGCDCGWAPMDPKLAGNQLQTQPPTSSQALDVTAHIWTRKHARKNARIEAKARVGKSVIIMSDKMPDGISEYMSYKTQNTRIYGSKSSRMVDRIVEWSLMGVTPEKYIEMEREKKFIRKTWNKIIKMRKKIIIFFDIYIYLK